MKSKTRILRKPFATIGETTVARILTQQLKIVCAAGLTASLLFGAVVVEARTITESA